MLPPVSYKVLDLATSSCSEDSQAGENEPLVKRILTCMNTSQNMMPSDGLNVMQPLEPRPNKPSSSRGGVEQPRELMAQRTVRVIEEHYQEEVIGLSLQQSEQIHSRKRHHSNDLPLRNRQVETQPKRQEITALKIEMLNQKYAPIPTSGRDKNALIHRIHQENKGLPLQVIASWANMSIADVNLCIQIEPEIKKLTDQYGDVSVNKMKREAFIFHIYQENKGISQSEIACWAGISKLEVSKIIVDDETIEQKMADVEALNQKYGFILNNPLNRDSLIFQVRQENQALPLSVIAFWANMSVPDVIRIIQIKSATKTLIEQHGVVPTRKIQREKSISQIYKKHPSLPLDMIAGWAGISKLDVSMAIVKHATLDMREQIISALETKYGRAPLDQSIRKARICQIYQDNPNLSLDVIASWAGLSVSDSIDIIQTHLAVKMLMQTYGYAPSEQSNKNSRILQIYQYDKMLPLEVIADWAGMSKIYVSKVIDNDKSVNKEMSSVQMLKMKYGYAPIDKNSRSARIYQIHQENQTVPLSDIAGWAGMSEPYVREFIKRRESINTLNMKYGYALLNQDDRNADIFQIYKEARLPLPLIADWADMPVSAVERVIQRKLNVEKLTQKYGEVPHRQLRGARILQIHKDNEELSLEVIAEWAQMSVDVVLNTISLNKPLVDMLTRLYGQVPARKNERNQLIHQISREHKEVPQSAIAIWSGLSSPSISHIIRKNR